MSIDKWLSKKDLKDEKLQSKTENSEETVRELKKQKINEVLNNKSQKNLNSSDESEDLIRAVIEFSNWLGQRKYLKGDKEQIEVWIKNLYEKLTFDTKSTEIRGSNKNKTNLVDQYNEIPLNFLEEKERIAINKKLKGSSRTTSDEYYLKKIKKEIEENLKRARYYKILKDIIESE